MTEAGPVEAGTSTAEAPPVESASPGKLTESALSAAVHDAEISELNAQTLIDAGVHFGHSSSNWNPKMKHLIFGKKNGIHVINIKETLRGAVRARYFVKQVASAGLDVLLVGTKKQVADVVRMEAARSAMPFVASRWLGGTLTNHNTIRRRLGRLDEIEEIKSSGKFDTLPKKQQSVIDREHRKISFNLEGLRELEKLPAVVFVIDVRHEKNAVAEARKLNIPVIGIVDTDSDPNCVDIAIPANDDSLRGSHILLHYVVEGIIEGRKLHKAGGGIRDKAGLQVSSYEELGPTGREKRRTRQVKGGRGRRQRSSAGDKSQVDSSVDEAKAQAEAQSGKGRAPVVRVKQPPKGSKARGPGEVASGSAPATEAKPAESKPSAEAPQTPAAPVAPTPQAAAPAKPAEPTKPDAAPAAPAPKPEASTDSGTKTNDKAE